MKSAAVLLACLCLARPVLAQGVDEALEGFDATAPAMSGVEDALGGFDAPAPAAAPTPRAAPPSGPLSPWTVSGSLSFSAAYDYAQPAPAAGQPDRRGLSRARPKAALKLKGDFPDAPLPARVVAETWASHDTVYALRGRGDYPATERDSFETDLNIGELYAGLQLNPSLELTLGRQVVVWGTSENLRVVDVVNPLDRRETGMVDIEDLRLPLAMARADWIGGPWSVTALAIPHIRFDRLAPARSSYDPMNGAAPPNDVHGDDLGNSEFAVRVKGAFSGWDASVMAANLYDDAGHKETVGGTSRVRHSRVAMGGGAVAVALGNWLAKGEALHTRGLETQARPGKDFARTDVLAGLEFTGIADVTVSLEGVNRHLHGWDRALVAEGFRRNSQEYALRVSADFLHELLTVTALTTRVSPLTSGGGFSRLSAEYDLADALTLSGGVTLYHDGTRTPFHALGDNDRVFVELSKSF
ncbi:MAG: hypothetical protein HQL35_15620 [Alphaproteobacteria bacterium]|nr:hypothetical protein [Alphaproteobacteria bacterium]